MTTSDDYKPALIIVDLQEDFCPPNGSLAVPSGRDIIPLVNSLLDLPFAIKIATKDWHPPNHVSFSSTHPDTQPFTSFTTITHPSDSSKSYSSRLWPDHCIQNTPGASLVPELDIAKVDVIVEKGQGKETEMYSAFRDPFGWQQSEIEAKLREKRVTDVVVVGLAGDYCVKATAEDAASLGWRGRVWVVDECVRCVDASGWEEVKRDLKEVGVDVVKFDGEEVGRVRALGKSQVVEDV